MTRVILIDTKEKRPWVFPGSKTARRSLQVYGYDYTIRGFEKDIGIERKSLSDLYQRVSNDKKLKLFIKNQIKKLQRITQAAIIVEGTPSKRDRYTSLDAEGLLYVVSDIYLTYGIPIIFAGTRQLAATTCYNFMVIAARNIVKVWRK